MTRSTLHASGVLLLAFATTVYSLELSQCDNVVMRSYYIDIGCVPNGDEPCPTTYNCDTALRNLSPGGGVCHYKNITVQNGESFESGEPCSGSCYCRVDANGVASYSCAVYDCPFGKLDPGCFPRYTQDQCCPVGTMCPDTDTSIARCEYNGETYYEGMSFSPKGQECVSCTCQKGFDGTIAEPWCKISSHNYILHRSDTIHDGCVPVFIKSVCYAPEFRCPNSNDQVVSSSATPHSTSQPKCKFGSLELKIGDKLSGGDSDCSCITPPQVTCTKSS